jgi:putative PIG3 family NAD(P)H quinone oxidoreductase
VKHLVVARRGDGYEARLAEAPAPQAQPGEVLVRVAASGVNRADLSQIAGRYPPPPGEPEILGLEVSGTIDGSGEPVCALLAGGGHAEWVAVPRGQTFPAPARLDLTAAAAIPEAFLTAYLNLSIEGGLAPGERVLVHAGASGVGLAAIQTARMLGAEVAATTRTAGKLPALEKAGAHLAIDTRAEDFTASIERRWGPDAIHVVLDPVGADTLSRDLAVLSRGGRVVVLAELSGARAEIDLTLLRVKNARLVGSTLRSRPRAEKAGIVSRFTREILPAFETGALTPVVEAIYPASNAAEAFTRMRENRNVGKILIDWLAAPGATSADPAGR